jgi:PAS domain S-box-containing protein
MDETLVTRTPKGIEEMGNQQTQMRILIVDDIAINRKLLRVSLEAEGHVTLEAADGLEAMQILAHEQVDAVVSDILMPRMDGYRLCHEIRTNNRLRNLPVVFYTSTYTSPSDEALAFNLGADKYLRKPAPIRAILTAVDEALAMQHTEPRPELIQEIEVLKQYSDRLVTKLEEKNIELEERLRLSALSRDVRSALIHGNSLREILQLCCEAFVEHLGAAFARIWTHNEPAKMLELQASAGMYTHIDGAHAQVPIGKLKIGLIAEKREPLLTNSVLGDPRVPEQKWAHDQGLVAFAGYPLIVCDRLVGVVAIFARNRLPDATLEKIASIADSIGLGIERQRAEEELHVAHFRLDRLLKLSPSVIYNHKIEGANIIPTFASDNLQRLLGLRVADTLNYEWWLQRLHPEDRARTLTTIQRGLEEGGYTAEYRMQHLDGTYRWIVDNNSVLRDATGKPEEMVGVWTDISEGKIQLERLANAQMETIFALAKIVESRDSETGRHLERVQTVCGLLATGLSETPRYKGKIDSTWIRHIFCASPLHDIGKVAIPDRIFQKAGPLTLEESAIMKTHAALGARTLKAVHDRYPDNEFIEMGIEIAQSHHEQWDGGGYPDHLTGEEIPISARIVAVADAYDAIRGARCYKAPIPHDEACTILLGDSGKHFDPAVMAVFSELADTIRDMWNRMASDTGDDTITRPVGAGLPIIRKETNL